MTFANPAGARFHLAQCRVCDIPLRADEPCYWDVDEGHDVVEHQHCREYVQRAVQFATWSAFSEASNIAHYCTLDDVRTALVFRVTHAWKAIGRPVESGAVCGGR